MKGEGKQEKAHKSPGRKGPPARGRKGPVGASGKVEPRQPGPRKPDPRKADTRNADAGKTDSRTTDSRAKDLRKTDGRKPQAERGEGERRSGPSKPGAPKRRDARAGEEYPRRGPRPARRTVGDGESEGAPRSSARRGEAGPRRADRTYGSAAATRTDRPPKAPGGVARTAQSSTGAARDRKPGGTRKEQGGAERLQKVLARAGFGSRRYCETLITDGRVTVDGVVMRELGVRVDPNRQTVAVDGDTIKLPRRDVYLAVYKPRGVLSDAGSPDEDVPTVLEMAPPVLGHLFPIGRLDLRSEGLVLLTSDGEVTHRLTHPSFEHAKVYYVLVEKRPGETELLRLRNGIELEDGMTAPARVEVVEQLPAELKLDTGPQRGIWLRFELTEGKKRQLRHMTAAVGLPTLRLVRWAIGPLALRDMAPGSVRYLSGAEVQKLREYAGLEATVVGTAQDGRTGRPGRTEGGRRGNRNENRGRPPAPGRAPEKSGESSGKRAFAGRGPGKAAAGRGAAGPRPGGPKGSGPRSGSPRGGNPRIGSPRGGRR